MIVRVSDDAERDLADGVAFYDQNGRDVGEHFLTSMLSYTVNGSTVLVVAILDERRDPEWVRKRLTRG